MADVPDEEGALRVMQIIARQATERSTALAKLLRAVKNCDSYANPESGLAQLVAAYEASALSSTDHSTP